MPRGSRSEEFMRGFAEEHLAYEFHMLLSTSEELSKGGQPQAVVNAYLESFSIHLRALVDFLWEPSRIYEDDSIASDFFENANEWTNIRPEYPDVLKPARSRTGKEIAHLTYSRMNIEPESKKWHFHAMTEAIVSTLKIFSSNANKKYLGNALMELRDE